MDIVSILGDDEATALAFRRGRPTRPAPPFELRFPDRLVDRAHAHLLKSGKRELEQLVLWAGYASDGGAHVTTLMLPETVATWGSVTVVRTEQPLIADWLYDHGQLLFVEAHTHGPGAWATELSPTDRAFPVSRQHGFITVVVPNYAKDGLDFRRCGLWECRMLEWHRVPRHETGRLRVIAETGVREDLLGRD